MSEQEFAAGRRDPFHHRVSAAGELSS